MSETKTVFVVQGLYMGTKWQTFDVESTLKNGLKIRDDWRAFYAAKENPRPVRLVRETTTREVIEEGGE